MKPRWVWPPASRWLGAFLLLNGLVLNLTLRQCTHQPTTLTYSRMFLSPGTNVWDDSWRPMQMALRHFDAHGSESVYEDVFFQQHVKFQYPPMSLLPLAALEWLHLGTDAKTLNALSRPAALALALVLALIFRKRLNLMQCNPAATGASAFLVYVALALGFTVTFYPVVLAFALGQIQTWITLLFALAALSWLSGRPTVAGALCGAIACVKPQWALLLPWACVRRQWKFAGSLAGTVAVLALASIALFGLASHIDYFRVLRTIAERGESFYANQSINGLLQRWVHNGGEWRADAFPERNNWVYTGSVASSLVIVAFAMFYRSREHDRESAIDLSIAVLSFTLASPIAWEHHYGVMLVIFAIALPVVISGEWKGRVPLLLLLVGAYVLSSNYFDSHDWSQTPLNVLQSYVLFAALVLTVILYRLRQSVALSAGFSAREIHQSG